MNNRFICVFGCDWTCAHGIVHVLLVQNRLGVCGVQVVEMLEYNPGQLGGTMRLGKRRTVFTTEDCTISKWPDKLLGDYNLYVSVGLIPLVIMNDQTL